MLQIITTFIIFQSINLCIKNTTKNIEIKSPGGKRKELIIFSNSITIILDQEPLKNYNFHHLLPLNIRFFLAFF